MKWEGGRGFISSILGGNSKDPGEIKGPSMIVGIRILITVMAMVVVVVVVVQWLQQRNGGAPLMLFDSAQIQMPRRTTLRLLRLRLRLLLWLMISLSLW